MHHTKITARLLASLAAAAALAACGSAPSTPDNPATTSLSPTPADLAGAWASDCVDPGNGQAFRLVFDLTEATWGLDYEAFADATCTTKNITVHIEGAYELGAASTTVEGAREGRFGFSKKTVTAHSDGAAAFVGQACGRDGIVAGTAADITGGCAGLGAYPVADCPADHDVVVLDDGVLHFGARPADNNMCTPEKRPTARGVALRRP